jgi:hypothetical protein
MGCSGANKHIKVNTLIFTESLHQLKKLFSATNSPNIDIYVEKTQVTISTWVLENDFIWYSGRKYKSR